MDPLKSKNDQLPSVVYYLDWHVVSYLSDPGRLRQEQLADILCLREALKIADRAQLALPYSKAHFADIAQGNSDRHAEWLRWLSNISQGWNILEMPGDPENVALQHVDDLPTHFDYYCRNSGEGEKEPSPFQPLFDNLIERSKEISRAKLQESGTTFRKGSALYNRALDLLQPGRRITGLDTIRFMKTLRGELRNPSGRRTRFPEIPNVKEKLVTSSNREFRRLANFAVKTSDLPYDSFAELEDSIPFISTGGFLSKFTERLNRVAMLAPYFGVGAEKVGPQTPPHKYQGMINDLTHASLGLRCNGFVSSDGPLVDKAIFAKRILDLSVQILRPKEFLYRLMKDYARVNAENSEGGTDETKTKYTFTFTDDSGGVIRTYEINPFED